LTAPTLHDDHDDFGGLRRDLLATGAAMDRRGLLRLAARFGVAAGALQLLGCGGSSPTSPSDPTTETGTSSGTGTGTGASACKTRIPQETAGPYPGDGSNGPDVLGLTGVVRSDIRSSFAGLSGTADGVPLTIALTIVSSSTCAPLAGRAVYIWHCDRLGRYSLYSSGVTNQNYLRGTQEADSGGRVTFTSVFRAVTRDGGRTFTSRCTRASPERPASRTKSRPRKSLCQRRRAIRCTPHRDMTAAPEISARYLSQPTASSATDTRSSSRRSTGA
jgi:hypothetical protein